MYFEVELSRNMDINRMLQMRTALSKSHVRLADSNQGKANGYNRKIEVASCPSDRAFIANGLHP